MDEESILRFPMISQFADASLRDATLLPCACVRIRGPALRLVRKDQSLSYPLEFDLPAFRKVFQIRPDKSGDFADILLGFGATDP